MRGKVFMATALMIVSFATALFMTPPKAYAACNDSLLGIPAWYAGLQESNCDIKKVGNNGGMVLNAFATKVGLNIVRAALIIVGYVAAFFIVKGGFLYVMSRGEPANLTAAKQTITNAIIGLIISLLSAAIVGAIGSAIN